MKVSDKVVQSLRSLIEKNHMQVGDRLPAERKLCEQLGVSRSSLREALQHLVSQGMLVSRVGAGTYLQELPNHWSQHHIVQPLSDLMDVDPEYRFDVQESRLILEGGTAWYAAQRATPDDIKKIRQCYDQIAHYQLLGDDDEAARADARFHLAIAEASHNVVLIQLMRSLFDLLQFNVVLGRRKVYSEAHRFDQVVQPVQDAGDRLKGLVALGDRQREKHRRARQRRIDALRVNWYSIPTTSNHSCLQRPC